MTKYQHLRGLLDGQLVEHVPISFWHHFPPDQIAGPEAVRLHLHHLAKYDLDFLKVMNDLPYPLSGGALHLEDLKSGDFTVLKGHEAGYGLQLELVKNLSLELRHKVPIIVTVMSAWTILRRLLMPPHLNKRGAPVLGCGPEPVDLLMNRLLNEDGANFKEALKLISESQANFARVCIETGADGIYFSIRNDWADLPGLPAVYRETAMKEDLKVIHAASGGWMNILHLCGEPHDFGDFARFPAHVLHWNQSYRGPLIKSVVGQVSQVICGGIGDLHSQLNPDPALCKIPDLLLEVQGARFILAPGCAYDPNKVSPQLLHRLVRLAHASRSQLANEPRLPTAKVPQLGL